MGVCLRLLICDGMDKGLLGRRARTEYAGIHPFARTVELLPIKVKWKKSDYGHPIRMILDRYAVYLALDYRQGFRR